MENNNNEKKPTVDVTYQGMIYIITVEEFEALQNGWMTMKEMFE